MSDLTRGERLQIMLTEEELKALDDWRFARRMPSRASAVRELLRLGLENVGFKLADQGRKSQSFTVMSDNKSAGRPSPAGPALPKADGDAEG